MWRESGLHNGVVRSAAVVFAMAIGSGALADDRWHRELSVYGTAGTYDDSRQRVDLLEGGLSFTADWLDRGGIFVGWTGSGVEMANNARSLEQDAVAGSAYWRAWPTFMPGRVSGRIDVYRVDNNDATGATDDVSANAVQFEWLSPGRVYYAELGYTASDYPGRPLRPVFPPPPSPPPPAPAPALDVRQWTPAFGFAFGEQWNWLQWRGYFINGLDARVADGDTATRALEMKYTRFFRSAPAPSVESLTLSAVSGRRLYAVDPEARSVANVADINTGSLSASLTVRLQTHTKLLLMAGRASYLNAVLPVHDDYDLVFGYASLTRDW